MASKTSFLTMDEYVEWMMTFHAKVPLPRYATELHVRYYLGNYFSAIEPIEIRTNSRMTGNSEGLGLLDRIDEQIKEASELRKKNEALNFELQKKLHKQLELISTNELLQFLPDGKRPKNPERNELVHGGDVKFDLSILESTNPPDIIRMKGIQPSDLEQAFFKRYSLNRADFKDGPSSIPEEMEAVINMRSNLTHLKVWEKATDPALVKLRDELKNRCSDIISRWLKPTEDEPYLEEEMPSTLDELNSLYYSPFI